MMVPRAFASSPFGASAPKHYAERDAYLEEKRRKSSNAAKQQGSIPPTSPRANSPPPTTSTSSPVLVPIKSVRPQLQSSKPPTSVPNVADPSRLGVAHTPPRRKEPVQDLLASTAIPIRRKPRQRAAQRITSGDYVADFSKLLLDDVRTTRENSLSSTLGNPQFEGLFGSIDGLVEGQMIVGSEHLDAGILTTRSLSTESMPSLASPEDFSSGGNASVAPSMARSISDRRIKLLATSENCASKHPLVDVDDDDDDDDDEGDTTPELSISPPLRKMPANRVRKPSTFKSSLTASLKAIKSAAQSVSSYAAPAASHPDDFLGNSFFDFHPSLTDDRRPPPTDEPPSPALRRYLNPHNSAHPESPAQLHFWIEDRSSSSTASPTDADVLKPKLKIKKKYLKWAEDNNSKLPPVVPLATCIPSQVRTAHASSPPVWLAPDGTPSNKQTAVGMWEGTEAGLKQREPRENRDFLRMYVCEMRMRNNRKLREDAEGRAKMWLPPIERDRRRLRPAQERLRPISTVML